MRSIRKSGVTALTAAIALSLGAVPVAFTAGSLEGASGTGLTAAGSPVVPEAWLTLQTGSLNQVALNTGRDSTLEKTQALSTGRNCLLTTDGSLLGFTGTSAATGSTNVASFSSNSIGVAEKKSGTSCYQVGTPDEALTLTLNKANVKGSLGPLLASSTLLDVELKQGAQILATLGKQGSADVEYRELRSGASINSPKPLPGGLVLPPEKVSICNNPADSGPDAGVLDNCLWAISKPSWLGDDGVNFDILKLQVINGSFSVEGGADGAVTNYSAPLSAPPGTSDKPPTGTALPAGLSFFELSAIEDGTIFCQDDPSTPDVNEAETVVRNADGDKPRVQIRRIGNADSGEECVAVPYALANGSFEATYYKPLNTQVSSQFIVDLTWRFPVLADGTVTVPNTTKTYTKPAPADLPATTIDFEITGEPGALEMGWCRDPIFTGSQLDGVVAPNSVPDMEPFLDKTQYACVGSREARSLDVGGKDYVEVHEQVYLQGDAAWRP